MSRPPEVNFREAADEDAGRERRSRLELTLAYHQRSKHHPFRYARSLGYMDWATQPDPFRRYEGARLVPLDLGDLHDAPEYDAAFAPGGVPAAPLDRASVSRLFHDALALSAWKQAGRERWALRVNPSSGNLHPTEGYLVAGPGAGLHDAAAVFHYAPLEHALELRAELPVAAWDALAEQLPPNAVLVGLTSIFWRESWKYGERGFRYCQHDAGHAIASVAIAAAGLGWEARLLERVSDAQAARLLGVDGQSGIEAEHPDGLLAVYPRDPGGAPWPARRFTVPEKALEAFRAARWSGEPNRLSVSHHAWPIIDEVAAATEKASAPGEDYRAEPPAAHAPLPREGWPVPLRRIIHQRRSAVALDARTGLSAPAFYRILSMTLPASARPPFSALPWRPCLDLLLFVHRVDDVPPGLYVLVRNPEGPEALRQAMDAECAWTPPEGCPAPLPLYLLERGDARSAARQTSCEQEIASDGAFAVAMLAQFRATLEAFGPWHYRRLHWEAGAIGQVLYLEAEAAGIRGTGIGCFFDDLTHRTFALSDDRYQVLYHFTMGGPVEDARLQTHPPYRHLIGR